MSMSPGMLYYVARIIGDLNPQDVVRKRGTIGTGFFITVGDEADPTIRHPYFMTAAHILKGQLNVEIQPPNPLTGDLYEPMEVKNWRMPLPKVDIAVAPCDWLIGDPRPMIAETLDRVIPTSRITEVRLANRVFYIGILTTFDRPMVRSGTLGMVNQEGISHDGGYDYPCHVVDCRSYNGFSGSPCWVQIVRPVLKPAPAADPTWDRHASTEGDMHHYYLLMGMFTEHLADESPVAPASRYGVGVMVRGEEIREALMAEEFKEQRRKRTGKLVRHEVVDVPPALKNLSAADAPLQRDDFEDALWRATGISEPDESAPEG